VRRLVFLATARGIGFPYEEDLPMPRQTRRTFLNRIATAVSTAVAVPLASLQAAGANAAIRLGLIGCGGEGMFCSAISPGLREYELLACAAPSSGVSGLRI